MHKPALNLLHLEKVPIFEQLQLEEALLRAGKGNWCVINEGSPPAIVLGVSSDPEELIDFTLWQAAPIPIIRRFSGGGTVVIDEETLFLTLICDHDALDLAPFPQQVLTWNAQLYTRALSGHPFDFRENDYVLGKRKFGGNAQYLTKTRWLHHSSLLWSYQQSRMDLLKIPSKAPLYRQARSHRDFLCCLSDKLSDKQSFYDNIKIQLRELFDVTEVSLNTAIPYLTIPHRKACHLISLP